MNPSPSTARRAGVLIGIATVVVAIAGGCLMRLLDPHEFPDIGSGLWWGGQTGTTVGYGDHVPVDAEGKALAAVVMGTRIGVPSGVTAPVHAAFVQSARPPRGGGGD